MSTLKHITYGFARDVMFHMMMLPAHSNDSRLHSEQPSHLSDHLHFVFHSFLKLAHHVLQTVTIVKHACVTALAALLLQTFCTSLECPSRRSWADGLSPNLQSRRLWADWSSLRLPCAIHSGQWKSILVASLVVHVCGLGR